MSALDTEKVATQKPKTTKLWALAMLLLSIPYILIEFAFNASLVDMASNIEATYVELERLANIGETLSGIGLAFVLINLIEWRFRTSTRIGFWGNVLLLAGLCVLTVPFMKWLQPMIINAYADATSGEERRQALNMNLFKYGAASGAVVFGGKVVGSTSEDKVLLALMGMLAKDNDHVHQTLTSQRDTILERVVLQSAQDQGKSSWERYLAVRKGVGDQYENYLEKVDQYHAELAKAGGKSGQALRQIREQTSAAYRKYQADGQTLVNQAGSRQSRSLDVMLDHNKAISKCRKDVCIDRANKRYSTEMNKIYGFVPPRSDFILVRNATAADGLERDGNKVKINLFSVIANTVSDRQISEISTDSVAAGYQKNEDRLFRSVVGYPKGLTEKQFMRQPSVCSQATAKAKSQGINVPSSWCPDDEQAVMAAVDGKARKRIDDEWAKGSKRQFGTVVSTSLSEQQFRDLKAVKNEVHEKLADAKCTGGNAYLSIAQFKSKCIEPGLKTHREELRKRFVAKAIDLEAAGTQEEMGKQAVRALIVPPVAIVFSLFFSLMAVIKFLGPVPLKVAGIALIIFGPLAMKAEHGEIAKFLHGDQQGVSAVLNWALKLEPAAYTFGSIFSDMVLPK